MRAAVYRGKPRTVRIDDTMLEPGDVISYPPDLVACLLERSDFIAQAEPEAEADDGEEG